MEEEEEEASEGVERLEGNEGTAMANAFDAAERARIGAAAAEEGAVVLRDSRREALSAVVATAVRELISIFLSLLVKGGATKASLFFCFRSKDWLQSCFYFFFLRAIERQKK